MVWPDTPRWARHYAGDTYMLHYIAALRLESPEALRTRAETQLAEATETLVKLQKSIETLTAGQPALPYLASWKLREFSNVVEALMMLPSVIGGLPADAPLSPTILEGYSVISSAALAPLYEALQNALKDAVQQEKEHAEAQKVLQWLPIELQQAQARQSEAQAALEVLDMLARQHS